MSEKSPAKSFRGLRRALILISIAAIWLLMLTTITLPVPAAQTNAESSALRGGRLYVAWDQVTNLSSGVEGINPLWPESTPDQVPDVLTWRCVNCHGWDYKGSDGKTLRPVLRAEGYPGLFNFTAAPADDILPTLNGYLDPGHDFSDYLSDEDMQDLAAFISSGLVVPELIADMESFQVQGVAGAGQQGFDEFCRSCHGAEGEKINLTTVENPTYLGDVAWANPWRMAHTIRYGHVSAQVPAADQLGIPFSQQIDIAAFTQTLPDAEIISGPDYQNIDLSAQASTTRLAYGAAAIVVLVFGAVAISLRFEKIRS
jgi:thiosulfate dehydrogenase